MIEAIVTALESRAVTAWQIRQVRKTSFQSFLAKTDFECARTVETIHWTVSIFNKRVGPSALLKTGGNGSSHTATNSDVMGMSTFKIVPQSRESLEQIVDEAIFATQLVSNQPFNVPSNPSKTPRVAIHDKSLDQKSLREFEKRLLAAVKKEKRTRLSSAEFFIDHMDTRLLNSRGLDLNQRESQIHTEFILLSAGKSRENEYISRYTRRFKKDFDLEGEVEQSARFAREATVADLPQTGSFPVLLSQEPLDQLFNPLVARASGRLKYNKMISSEIGQSVVADGEVKGDRVTLWSNPLLKGGLGSQRFDGYGTPAQRVCLIEKNILKNYLADKRYADYLALPVTGELGNIEVAPGATPFKNLQKPETANAPVLYHLQAFSAFEPNAITGAFSAEIRAGYEISQKGVRPIKGGSVSGVLQHDLLDCLLSKEQVQRERALLPQGVLFKKLTIAGK